jgi:cyanophycinase
MTNITSFSSGGDQIRIIESYYNGEDYAIESPALSAIKSTLEATGGVVAGTSAGTDCQTINTMITGGYSYEGIDSGVQIYDNPEDIHTSSNKVTAYSPGGIGLFPYGLVDTHYANRGRQGRSMSMLMDTAKLATTSTHSFGVDENTALVITGAANNRIGTVIGERSVFVLSSQYATSSGVSVETGGRGRTINGLLASRMTHNDSIDLTSYTINFASYKTTIKPADSSDLYHSKDIFASDAAFEFDKVVDSLLQSTASSSYGTTKERLPRYQVNMEKSNAEHGITVKAVGGSNPSTQAYEISYDGLWISVTSDK